MNIIKKFFIIRESSLLIINLAIILFLSFRFPLFTSANNIFGMLYAISINSIIAGAMTVLFVSGGFDMSAGVTAGFCGMVVGVLMVRFNLPITLSCLLTIILGAALGTFIGFLVSYININPFVVTLSAWFIIESFIYIVSGGKNQVNFPSEFSLIASYKILNVPMIIIFALCSLIIFEIVLRRNVYFRQNFAIGGNESAAILAGIKVKRVKMLNYTLVSAMAAVAGIFLTSRFMAAYLTAGSENAFQIITAVIIGGASLRGGKGSVLGTFLGLVLMALVFSAFIFFKMDVLWNRIAIGLILILAVIIDENIQKERTIRIKA